MNFESVRGPENLEKAVAVYEDARSEVLGSICSPADGQECFDTYEEVFNTVFQRATRNNQDLIEGWENNKEAYKRTLVREVLAEAHGPEHLEEAA